MSSTGLRRYPRLQYRLRTAMIVVTVFCIGAWLVSLLRPLGPNERRAQRRLASIARAPRGVELVATLDAKTYRVGDPIRLHLELMNNTTNSYELIMPELYSGGIDTMAYGIRLNSAQRDYVTRS